MDLKLLHDSRERKGPRISSKKYCACYAGPRVKPGALTLLRKRCLQLPQLVGAERERWGYFLPALLTVQSVLWGFVLCPGLAYLLTKIVPLDPASGASNVLHAWEGIRDP